MSLLSPSDIAYMQQSVRECIECWGTYILLLRERPAELQPNYNELLKEYTGDIMYDEFKVPAERYDQLADTFSVNGETLRTYGSRDDNFIMYHMPDTIPVVPTTDMFVVDTQGVYYIETVTKRIGQYIVHCKRHLTKPHIHEWDLKNSPEGWL